MDGLWIFGDSFTSYSNTETANECTLDGTAWLDTNNTYFNATECLDVNKVATECRCNFVTNVSDCNPTMGYIDYTQHMYCLYGPDGVTAVVGMSVVWLLLLFVGLGITANDFLCPSLFIISKTLRMSQNVAGVTLLAFGNGSPDIFSAIAGINQGKTEMVIGGLIGGGIFVTTVVAGSIFLTQNFKMMKRPFLRDVIFYMAAASIAFYLFFNGRITLIFAIICVLLYVMYIVVVIVSRLIHQKHLQYNEKAAEAANVEKGLKIKGTNAGNYDNPEAYGVVLTAFFKYNWEHDRRRSTVHHHTYDNEVFSISLPNIDEELPPPSYEETNIKALEAFRGSCVSTTFSKSSIDEKVPIPEPVNQWWDFVEKVCPVNLAEWHKQTWRERIIDIVKGPIMIFLVLTTPLVDYKSPRDNWCRVLNSLHMVTGPVFIIFAVGAGGNMIGGVMPLGAIVAIVGAVLAAVIFVMTNPDTVPRFHTAYAYVGFGVAVVWIYCIANEIVVLLQAVGIVFHLSESILGLTILAWGNCLLDFLSNVAVARKGFPRMGIAACFGAPFLTLLLGIGVPCMINLIEDDGAGMSLIYSPLTTILFSALAISLISTLTMMIVCKFQTKKWYGVFLICLYLAFLLTALLKESGAV
ncbi:mitochondrial sodium/calcium exchanger protein-like [Uloborus diversus]|uniref:mitochondrial sodium/calcium exchanger protein-like n=1 Tax=Uloborus diversus TaxID=327109 RepID=UPI002409E13C|nr:mitochondrial sodium/calcium exchanger protein-like [Uloborus diversus]